METKLQQRHTSHTPNRLPYQLLKRITNDFAEDRILERGTYGTSFKGVYENGGQIAVNVQYGPIFDDRVFHKELRNHSGLKHPNIVELVGFCDELEEVLAVYEGKQVTAVRQHTALCFEYVHNGSLNKHISDENKGLNWPTRYRIIKGICEGLKYLHEGLDFPIMHFDIKPDSILLDKNMVPKISNFELSRLFSEEDATHTMSCVGTCGYWPPEYIKHQIISKKFDIFSLGITIVKIMAGYEGFRRFSEDMTIRKFTTIVHKNWRKQLRRSKTQLVEAYCYQVKRCIEIALDCLESNRHERPTISDIVSNLSETERMIGDQGLQIKKFYQDDSEESTFLSKSNITFRPSSAKVMTFNELRRITDGFSDGRLLGKGGYGNVYMGVLDNGEKIAVKKIHNKPGQVEEQFTNELIILSMVQHQNIIKLVGYCSEARDIVVKYEGVLRVSTEEERALCLEYIQGGTLDDLLSDESGGLDWDARLKIIKGMCKGLQYLHTGLEDPICHLDLKPANILLDKDRMPKIGDFGTSKVLGTTHICVAKALIGTRGYMPPEYIDGLEFSPNFDVFSLGVIIIEVIAGRNAYNNYKSEFMSSGKFTDKVTGNWRKREQTKPMSTEALLEIQKCIKIALRCVEDNPVKRPTITEIVEELYMTDLHPAPFGDDGSEPVL